MAHEDDTRQTGQDRLDNTDGIRQKTKQMTQDRLHQTDNTNQASII